jgi:hypothetical protein
VRADLSERFAVLKTGRKWEERLCTVQLRDRHVSGRTSKGIKMNGTYDAIATLDRRSFLAKTAVGAAMLLTASGVTLNPSWAALAHAHDATPAPGGSTLDGLGLPLLDVTIEADGTIVMPDEVPAGTVLLRVHSLMEGEGSFLLVQPPDGITEEEVKAAISAPEIPAFLHQSVVNGGIEFLPGTGTNSASVQEVAFNLGAGSWYAVQASERSQYKIIAAVGEPAIASIPASVNVTASHHDFEIAKEVTAGPSIWGFTNADPVLHHLVLFSYPEPLTEDQALQALIASEGMATPQSGVDPAQIEYVGGTGLLSQDQTCYQEFDLAPGAYFSVCYLSDPGMDTPHVVNGMIQVFTAV